MESAGSPTAIGWDKFQHQLSIFRLHSGVDLRSRNIASFIDNAISQHTKVTLLVEHQDPGEPTSFGELLQDEIRAKLPNWEIYVSAGSLTVVAFGAHTLDHDLAKFRVAISKKGVVLLLGIGSQYKAIADQFYRMDQPGDSVQAQFGSWMTAYAINDSETKYRTDRIFEITDVDVQNTDVPATSFAIFERAFGTVSPALRDQAFSFDAGLCILRAFQFVKTIGRPDAPSVHDHPLIDEAFAQRFANRLRTQQVLGVTGEIHLDKGGYAENTTRMTYCRYDQASKRWIPVNYLEIVKAASTPKDQ